MHNVSILMSYQDLSARTAIAVGTLRNKVSRKEFVQGVHYIKSSRGKNGKVLFLEAAFQHLLKEGGYHE
ncbi:MAG: hypothetical protein C0602_05955 [Denitrovibrio sp.]|nr:MAG: hypothetical protein C0602_05955 [Denitrovibrio sp.]